MTVEPKLGDAVQPDEPVEAAWVAQAVWEAEERREHAAAQDFDRAVLTLSAGTLALSATFLHDIAPNPVGCSIALLIASWIFLVAAAIAVVLSFLPSQRAHRLTMGEADASRATTWTRRLNYVAAIGFVGGIALFALFALINL